MKRYVSIIAAGFILPMAHAGDRDHAKSQTGQSPTGSENTARGSISVLPQTQLQQWTMAADLSGKAVVNRAGETVGRVHGISLEGLEAKGAGEAHVIVALDQQQSGEGDRYLALPITHFTFDAANEQLQLTLSPEALPALLAGGFRAGSASSAEEQEPQTTSRPSTESSDSDDTGSAQRAASIAATAQNGAGPVYQQGNDSTEVDPANTVAPVGVAAPSGTSTDLTVATTGLEVDQIKDALASSDQTKAIAEQIGVMSATESVLITGTVQSDEQRQKVLEVVRGATQRDVQDLMVVRAAAE